MISSFSARSSQRGDIALYLGLIVLVIVTSASVIVVLLLAQQPSLSREIVASEKAFYAANSGLEHALFVRVREGREEPVSGTTEADVTYEGFSKLLNNNVCAKGNGSFAGTERRVVLESVEECDLDE